MTDCLWSLERRADLVVVRCAALDVAGVGHVFTTAEDCRGGVFDVGPYAAADVCGDWRGRVLQAAGLRGRSICDPRQTHGDRVVTAAEPRSSPDADGVVAFRVDSVNLAPAVRTADCVPLLLVTRDGSALGAIHAGWRGAGAGVVERAFESFAERGVAPGDLIAAMGPAIGICCFRVGQEVVDAMEDRFGSLVDPCTRSDAEGMRLGLGSLIRSSLIERGLAPEAVHTAPWCTACSDIPLFSYRRQGARAGRQLACAGWLKA